MGLGIAIRRGRGAVARDTHYVLAGDAPAPFLPYLGLLSDFCYRRADSEEVRDACFCAAEALYVRSRAGLIFRTPLISHDRRSTRGARSTRSG